MNEEQLQLLWDLNAKDAGFTDYSEFKTLMGDSKARKTYFDTTNSQLGFTDYSEFESLLGLGGAQEVSSQEASEPTSQEFGGQSGTSAEASSEPRRLAEFPDVVTLVDVPEGEEIGAEKKSAIGDIYYSLAAGSSAAVQMVAGIPQYLYELAAIPQNILADAVANNAGEEAAAFLRADFEQVKDLPPLQAAAKVSNYYKELSEENRAQVTQFEQGILENLGNGNFADAGRQVVNSIAESVPSMMIMLATSGAGQAAQLGTIGRHALSALPFASGSYQELEGNENLPDAYKPVVAGLHGLSEIVFEQSFGTTALVEEIINNRISREGVKQFVEGYLQKALSSQGIPMALVRGGASEAATELSNNIIDKYTGVDPDRDLMQGVADAAIVGSVMDGGIRTVSTLSDAVVGSNKQRATELEQEINQEREDLNNPEVSDRAKDVIQESLESKTEELDEIIGESREQLSQLSPEQQQQVGRLIGELDNLQEAIQDPNVSEQTKVALQQQAEQLSTEIDNLIAETGVATTEESVVESSPESVSTESETDVVPEQQQVAVVEETTAEPAEATDTGQDRKQAQFEVIQQSNPAPNDVNTWVRSVDDIKTAEEAFTTPRTDGEMYPDFKISDMDKALESGEVKLYSSYPIEAGVFVTPSRMNAESYAGGGRIYEKTVPVNDVAWIDEGEGQYAPLKTTDTATEEVVDAPIQESVQAEEVPDGVQQTSQFMNREQAETVNTALQERGFTPEESTSFLQDIQTEGGRSNRKQAAADRIRQYWQSQQNLGIANQQNPEEFARFIRDVAEYAAVSILDGSIRTARGLAKAIGVTYDESIQQAFEQAQAIVQPIQEATVTPPRTTTKGQIRAATQGGIQGKVTLTNRQALKTQIQTLNRGIREGRKQITESRKEITDFIKGMKEAGLFRGKVRGSTVNALINRVNKANTPTQLRNALDYAEKASRIIDYDQKLATANTLKGRAKRLAKRKGMPADIVPILKGMGGIDPRYIDNIEAFNEQLAELISAVDGSGIDGIGQTQHRDLITSVKNKIEQARIQALKDQLIDAGMGSDFVDALNTMNQLLEAVASIPDESKPSGESKREFRERIYEQTKELLGELDRTELSPQQSAALDALLGIDVSQVSDQMMATIAVVGKNAAVNQSFAGAGPIIAEYRLQQETSNQKNVDKVKSTVRIASRIGKATRERFGTVIAQIDAAMRDQQAASAFYALTGFGGILEGSTRYGHRADGVKKIVEDLSKKHAKDLSDPVQSAMYAMYADLNQYKNTWTEEQRVEEFNKRKEAIQTSIDRIEEQMGRDKHFEAQQRDYLSNVKKAWEQVKSAKHPDEIYDKLNNGFKAAYSEMRGFYDSILPEMHDNALIHNNTDLDTDWVNYFPRSYKKLGRPATERKIEQIEEMAGSTGIPLDDIVNQGESSGAKQNRVITGAQLPANATINFDAFNSFYDSSLRALYDIETQPSRQYAARAFNSGRVAEIFGDTTPLEIFRNATIQKISNDQLGLYGGPTSRFRAALRAMSTWGTRLALGGVGQLVKQSIPQMSDTVVRLGNNAHLLAVGLSGYLKYNDLLNEAIKDQPVSRRNVATIERQTSVINKRELNEIRRGLSTGVLRGLGIADKVVEAISLSSLKWGDDAAAKASWLAFYLEYKKRNGETVVDLASELQNPSKEAKAYATQRLELTNNVSDPSLRSNTSKHIAGEMLAVIAPFSSFAINAKLELATSLARLRELGTMNNQERLRTIRNVGGNVANILVYNVVGKMIRNVMIGGTASLAYALLNNDDWDEDDEKAARELIDTWESDAIARNEENSTEYLVNDLIFGGIAEQSLQPGIDVIKDLYSRATGEETKERFARPRTIYDALGIFGIPFRTSARFFNDLSEWTMTDAEWQMRKFSIEDAWGETRYVPLEYRGINRPIFSRKGFGLTTLAHGAALTGASSQEVSALANRLPGLISQIETKLHGRDRKDKLAENESLRKIRVAGQTKELTEEQWKWTVNERRKFLEEVETSDRFVTLQKDELASKVGDELSEKVRRETATKYARAKAIVEFNLVDGVGEKIAKDAKKKAGDIISAADLWKKQLNPNTYPKQKEK